MAKRSPALLALLAQSHWGIIQSYDPGTIHFSSMNITFTEHGYTPEATVLLVIEDMPFLVDSLRLGWAMGIAPQWMVYTGGLQLHSDSQGHSRVTAYGQEPESRLVSPILLEIPLQRNQEKVDNIELKLKQVLRDVRMSYQDWPLMCEAMRNSIKGSVVPAVESQETMAYLEWLLDDHLLSLGCEIIASWAKVKKPACSLFQAPV